LIEGGGNTLSSEIHKLIWKVPTRSNKVSPRTLQTALVFCSFRVGDQLHSRIKLWVKSASISRVEVMRPSKPQFMCLV
jgi:hypothetical protein